MFHHITASLNMQFESIMLVVLFFLIFFPPKQVSGLSLPQGMRSKRVGMNAVCFHESQHNLCVCNRASDSSGAQRRWHTLSQDPFCLGERGKKKQREIEWEKYRERYLLIPMIECDNALIETLCWMTKIACDIIIDRRSYERELCTRHILTTITLSTSIAITAK